MTQPIVRAALETALNTWAAGQGLAVAWENTELAPEPDETYLRVFLLWAPTLSPDMSCQMRSLYGVFQVSIVAPAGGGPGAAEVLAESLGAVFSPATPLTAAGGLKVWFTQPMSRGPSLPDGGRFLVPCSIPLQAHYST